MYSCESIKDKKESSCVHAQYALLPRFWQNHWPSMARHEVIAVILASTPVPPLPQLVIRGEDNLDSFTSSHDTLAAAMIHVLHHGNEKTHEERRKKQNEVLMVFQETFGEVYKKWQLGLFDGEHDFYMSIYDTFCGYTRYILATYDPQGRTVESIDLRFEAYDNIKSCKKGESIFDSTYDHLSSLINILNHEIETSEDGREKVQIQRPEKIRYDEMLQLYFLYAWI